MVIICCEEGCQYRVPVVAKIDEDDEGMLAVKWHVHARKQEDVCLTHTCTDPCTIQSRVSNTNYSNAMLAATYLSLGTNMEPTTAEVKGILEGYCRLTRTASRLQRIVVELKKALVGTAAANTKRLQAYAMRLTEAGHYCKVFTVGADVVKRRILDEERKRHAEKWAGQNNPPEFDPESVQYCKVEDDAEYYEG